MTRQKNDPPTIRESTIPDTRRNAARASPIEEYVEPKLTGPFFHGYQLIRQFPATGGEADIWLILKDKEYGILKHYRLGIEPKLEVLEKVTKISQQNPKHLVRIYSFGFDEETQRWYEIQEYAKNGSLKELIQAHKISTIQFRTIIEEIASGLEALHRDNILHLDLKPSNILVRSIRPLNLILTDFGISTLLDTELTRQITSTKGTPMYWAPEQLGNIVGKEADYWSLGVIALEIFQGRHPFEGMNQNIILATLSTKGVLVPPDIQPKTAVLLKGLLTRNPKKRWGISEIERWLAGRQNIPVHYEGEREPERSQTVPYEFRDEQFYLLTDLCYAFIRDPVSWEDAKRHVGRGYLTRWLEKTEQYGAAVEIEKYIEQYPKEDERVLYIAARFNDDIPFSFFGKPLDVSGIVEYLGRYINHKNDEAEKRIISMLFSGDLYRIYQIFTSITGHQDEGSLINQMFAWLTANSRGIDEKRRLYDYLRVLKEREEIGSPGEWDTRIILKLAQIRELFQKQGYDADATRIEEDLKTACEEALRSESAPPDLLVALASVSEAIGKKEFLTPCLRKASDADIRVISLFFNRKTGIERFQLYKRLRSEYETQLFTLSPEPWSESSSFWRKQFFVLIGKGEFTLALSVSERLIGMERTNGEGYAMRGVSLAYLGRVKEAEFFITHKTVQGSKSPQVRQILAEYYRATNKFDDAEQSFRDGLALDKNNRYLTLGLIDLYSSQKRYRDIVELCDTALQTDPSDKELILRKADTLFALGRIPEAIRTYEQYLIMVPGNTDVLKCLARCQIKLRKNSEAEQSVDILLKKGVTDSQVLRLKAYLLLIGRKVQEALRYLDLALVADPGDIWTLRIKADAHISLKDYLPALASINQVLEKEPGNIQMLEKKGKIFLLLGFFADAAASLKAAIDRGNVSADIYAQYADALRHGGQSRYGSAQDITNRPGNQVLKWRTNQLYLDIWSVSERTPRHIEALIEAIEWYDKSLVEGGEESFIWNRKGIITSLLGDYDQAEVLFERAVESNVKEPAFLTNLAVMHILKGNTDKGVALLLQGMSKFANRPYFLDQCAGMYFIRKNDTKNALELSRQAIPVNANRDPIIPYHTLLILRASGLHAEAEKMVRMIHMLDPWFDVSDTPSEH